jgi:hypothetical protein
MKRWMIVFMVCSLLLASLPALAQDPLQSEDSTAAWREDLSYFWEKIVTIHPDPFRQHSQSDFEEKVAALDADIPNLTDEQIIVRMMEFVSMLEDGHSWFYPSGTEDYDFHFYPINFYEFSDGVYVLAATSDYEDAIGARLLSIGGTDIADLMPQLDRLATGDNEYSRLTNRTLMLNMPEILLGAGIISDTAQPSYVLEKPDGEQITLNPVQRPLSELNAAFPSFWLPTQREGTMSLARMNEGFWWTYLEAEQVIYFQYNQVFQQAANSDVTMLTVIRQLEEAFQTLPVQRFILDMRYNGGGNINTARGFLSFFKEEPFFQEPDTLIVLTGRATFSASVVFSLWLEQELNPVFMGEPTGGQPMMFENHRQDTLPNSGLQLLVATRARQDVPDDDTRRSVEPDVPLILSSEDYFADRDPVLQAALDY